MIGKKKLEKTFIKEKAGRPKQNNKELLQNLLQTLDQMNHNQIKLK